VISNRKRPSLLPPLPLYDKPNKLPRRPRRRSGCQMPDAAKENPTTEAAGHFMSAM